MAAPQFCEEITSKIAVSQNNRPKRQVLALVRFGEIRQAYPEQLDKPVVYSTAITEAGIVAYASRGQEHVLWAAATLVERDWGSGGSLMISRIIDDLIGRDDIKGVEMWLKVAERLEQLQDTQAGSSD